MDKIYPEEHIQAIANAIRRKNGKSVNYLTSEMAGAIDQLVSYPEPTGTEVITENGIVDVKDKEYADVNVQATPTLISKTITANGEYDAEDDEADGYSDVTVNVPNSYVAADEGKVVSSGALVAQTSTTVTQNGTYDTTENDEVVVNVSGGGGTPTMTRAEWNALTTAQKKSYGLVGIEDASAGYNRGQLVYGADYNEALEYLPYSDPLSIICSAYPDNYDDSDTSWGYGTSPVTFSAAGSAVNADGSVAIKTKTNGTLAYVDLGASSTPFTAYIVAKVSLANSSYTRLLSAMDARSSGRGILLYGSTAATVSSWGSDTAVSPTVNPTTAYFVGAISFGGSGDATGAAIASAISPVLISKTPSVAGRYITIGRTDISSSSSNAEPTDMDVLFVGVVNAKENDAIVANNMRNLASTFL